MFLDVDALADAISGWSPKPVPDVTRLIETRAESKPGDQARHPGGAACTARPQSPPGHGIDRRRQGDPGPQPRIHRFHAAAR